MPEWNRGWLPENIFIRVPEKKVWRLYGEIFNLYSEENSRGNAKTIHERYSKAFQKEIRGIPYVTNSWRTV